MSTTNVVPIATGSQAAVGRPFGERVEEAVASALLVGIAAFAAVRYFMLKRKASKAAPAA